MSVYEPLTRHLKSLRANHWRASFADVERVLQRSLPSSAYEHRPWWGNQKKGNHSQARAWRDAGWETREVDLKRRTVRFERVTGARSGGNAQRFGGQAADLWDRAAKLSGIEERERLIEEALSALIQREVARKLIAMGGTMPDFTPAPRERPFA